MAKLDINTWCNYNTQTKYSYTAVAKITIPWPFEYSPDQRGGSPAGKGRQKDDHAWKEVKNQAKSPQKSKLSFN